MMLYYYDNPVFFYKVLKHDILILKIGLIGFKYYI